jgi:hypothetical protein
MRKRSIIGLAAIGAFALPAAAQAHTSAGSASCALAGNVPTITSHIDFTAFAASGAGHGGTNAPHYETVVDGASVSAQASFPGAGASYTQTRASSAGSHTVSVFTVWASSETRDGNSQARTQVYTGSVTCPTPVVPPAPPAPPAPPVVTPPVVAPPVVVPPVEVAPEPVPVVTPPAAIPAPTVAKAAPNKAPRKHRPVVKVKRAGSCKHGWTITVTKDGKRTVKHFAPKRRNAARRVTVAGRHVWISDCYRIPEGLG